MANKVRRPRLTLARPTTVRLCLRPVLCPFADRLHRGKWISTYTHRAEVSLHLQSSISITRALVRLPHIAQFPWAASVWHEWRTRPPPTPHTILAPQPFGLSSSGALPICRPIASGQMDQHLHPSGRTIFAPIFRGGKACSARVAFYRERTQAPLLLHTLSSPQPTWLPSTQVGAIRLQRVAPAEGEKPPHAHSSAYRTSRTSTRRTAMRVSRG